MSSTHAADERPQLLFVAPSVDDGAAFILKGAFLS
jgi:hypothetical protein